MAYKAEADTHVVAAGRLYIAQPTCGVTVYELASGKPVRPASDLPEPAPSTRVSGTMGPIASQLVATESGVLLLCGYAETIPNAGTSRVKERLVVHGVPLTEGGERWTLQIDRSSIGVLLWAASDSRYRVARMGTESIVVDALAGKVLWTVEDPWDAVAVDGDTVVTAAGLDGRKGSFEGRAADSGAVVWRIDDVPEAENGNRYGLVDGSIGSSDGRRAPYALFVYKGVVYGRLDNYLGLSLDARTGNDLVPDLGVIVNEVGAGYGLKCFAHDDKPDVCRIHLAT